MYCAKVEGNGRYFKIKDSVLFFYYISIMCYLSTIYPLCVICILVSQIYHHICQTGGAKKVRVDEPPHQMQVPSQPLPVQQPTYQQPANALVQQQQMLHLTPQAQHQHAPVSHESSNDDGSEDDSSGEDDESD